MSKPSDAHAGGDAAGQRPPAGPRAQRQGHRADGQPEERQVNGEGGHVADADPAAAERDPDEQARPTPRAAMIDHGPAIAAALASTRLGARDRVGEHEREDPVLLLAGGDGRGGR